MVDVVTAILYVAMGGIGSILAWVFIGIPLVVKRVNARVTAEKESLFKAYKAERAGIVSEVTESIEQRMPLIIEELKPSITEAVTSMTPTLIEAFISSGASELGKKSQVSQAMAKAGLKNLDIEGVLSGLQGGQGLPPELANILQGAGLPTTGAPGSIKQGITQLALERLVPKKYKSWIPLLTSGMGGGGTAAPVTQGNGGFNPGLPGR